jgi:hypothetical protein
MEEKIHFKYDANIKMLQQTVEPPVEDYRILKMTNLQPFSVKWQTRDGNQDSLLVYLDFNEEVVYNKDYKNLGDTNLGKAILEVLEQKKTKAMDPIIPLDALNDIINARKNAQEGHQNARETAF